ncbi:MAG: ABC transporter ATP-binding protein [Anaerolineales bacterium]|nr:ABC transporter ATP-binding protein [Anaerolineales bacterium]
MIEVKNLNFTYPQATRPTLQGMNFSIERGELFGFLGPSGAGKSTTQKILIGLLKNYMGLVSVFGKSLTDWKSDYYERIGVSFEFPNHFLKLTALENLTYFSRLYSGPTELPHTLLELVGLANDGHMPVSQYSKGMKNRLSVVRALLHQPQLLFLDEPTAGLDPVNARRVKELIKAQQQAGKTVFLTTHDMTVADELCDRVAFIADGQIKAIDRPRELKLRYGQARVRVEYQDINGAESREFPLAGLGDNAEFLGLLRDHQVQTLHTLEASLEEVFIQVTGRELL